jgi:hypothetical protein
MHSNLTSIGHVFSYDLLDNSRYMDYYGRGPTLRDAEGHVGIDWLSPQLWVMVASNFSVALAFYGLMSFYHAVCEPMLLLFSCARDFCALLVLAPFGRRA